MIVNHLSRAEWAKSLLLLFCIGIPAVVLADGPYQLQELPAMNSARAVHAAVKLNAGDVLLLGGCTRSNCEGVTNSVERYQPGQRSFVEMPAMHEARASASAVKMADGSILISGGWNGKKALNSAERFDPATQSWQRVGNMHEARTSHQMIALNDGSIYVFGGGHGKLPFLRTVEKFHPPSQSFELVMHLPMNFYLATRLPDQRILLTGGQTKEGQLHRRAGIFDPKTERVELIGELQVARIKHAAVPMNNKRVLIVGGSDLKGFHGRYNSSEILDLDTGHFAAGPLMQFGRHKIDPSALLLPDGNVLIAGGAEHPEWFDASANRFHSLDADLQASLSFTCSTLLSDNTVLITGGYDARIQPTAKAWRLKLID